MNMEGSGCCIKRKLSLEEIVGQAIGEASGCWSNPGGAGVFDDQRAQKLVSRIMAAVNEPEAVEERYVKLVMESGHTAEMLSNRLQIAVSDVFLTKAVFEQGEVRGLSSHDIYRLAKEAGYKFVDGFKKLLE